LHDESRASKGRKVVDRALENVTRAKQQLAQEQTEKLVTLLQRLELAGAKKDEMVRGSGIYLGDTVRFELSRLNINANVTSLVMVLILVFNPSKYTPTWTCFQERVRVEFLRQYHEQVLHKKEENTAQQSPYV
jgi:hypothetical protein